MCKGSPELNLWLPGALPIFPLSSEGLILHLFLESFILPGRRRGNLLRLAQACSLGEGVKTREECSKDEGHDATVPLTANIRLTLELYNLSLCLIANFFYSYLYILCPPPLQMFLFSETLNFWVVQFGRHYRPFRRSSLAEESTSLGVRLCEFKALPHLQFAFSASCVVEICSLSFQLLQLLLYHYGYLVFWNEKPK